MIAMLLAAQLSAEIARGMSVDVAPAMPPHAAPVRLLGGATTGLIRTLPARGNCPGAGRMEASLAQPIALYRVGDRPPRVFLRWADYPEGRFCQTGVAP